MRVAASFIFAFLAAGCAGTTSNTGDAGRTSSDSGHEEADGVTTGSTCPPGSTLTYENFAQPFMTAHCIRCHSSALTGAARNGAPEFHDFDTEEGILNVAEHVDQQAAAGPNAVNVLMPRSGSAPSAEDRRKLGEWLACEMAQGADAGSHHSSSDGGP